MADRKRQHYVPKFYLRNFASDHARRTINIFNIKRERTIPRTSLRDQCYKDYFYGREPRFEESLGILETPTSVILQRIIDSSSISDTPVIIMHLCSFLVLQFRRTLAAEADTNDMVDKLFKAVYRPPVDKDTLNRARISMTNASAFNALTGMLLSPICFDLKPALLINLTNRDFVTSDNPVILVNQFWSGRFLGDGTNLAASGLMILLPLSPKHTLLMYDQSVYSVPKDSGNRILMNRLDDIVKLNEMQMLAAFDTFISHAWIKLPHWRAIFKDAKRGVVSHM